LFELNRREIPANKNPLQVFVTGKGLIHKSEWSEKIQQIIAKFIENLIQQ